MNDKHKSSLKQYVNDMIALERDILNAVKSQTEDDRVRGSVDLVTVLEQVVRNADTRIELLKELSHEEDGSLGAAVKESVTAVTGVLAGIYGKLREHPLSRMVRDDIVALEVTSVSYGMLLTLGLSIGHQKCVTVAEKGLEETPPLIIALTDMLPLVVAHELSEDAPLVNPAASQIAQTKIRDAWKVSR
ncbi:MAG: hypothetical protein EOP85_03920 [Verrucomicrobiaceae bacterium]|nr:MAG: hypothetical protein EOP85_03920 [Verrucomicrobiaceae bacterium]